MRHFGIGAPLAAATFLASALVAATLMVSKAPWGTGAVPSALVAQEPYAVAVHSERAAFDLNFSPDSRYVVVIGSLGSSERRFEVGCSSRPVPALRLGPGDRIPTAGTTPFAKDVGGRWLPSPIAALARGTRPAGNIPVSFATSEPGAAAGSPREPNMTEGRSFALHVTDGSLDDPAQYVTIRAHTIAEGRQVRVYLDDQQSPHDLAPGLVQNVTELFDNDVVPRFRGVLGTYRDVDHDGRFAVLLSPWLSRLQGGRTSVGGFVRGSDFQSRLGLPFSNQCDMMYVNSQTIPGPHLRTLLIHEYTHAVCFSRRTADGFGQPRFPEEEDWLNEALAHCAESLFQGGWSNLDYRIARFLNDPAAFPLVVGDYYRAGLWRCHGCRGATYLFLRYCLERFGPETLTRIIANPARGTRNIELATGCSFDRLFRDWTLSLVAATARGPLPEAVDAAAQPTLAPLDLYGPLGEWGLAGPRRQIWDVDAGPQRIVLRGTSAVYLELFASGPAGPRRLSLGGPLGSELQISVVRLDDDTPRIEAAAAWSEPPANRQSSDRQLVGDRLHTIVRFANGDDLAIEQISAEQNSDETHTSVCYPGAALGKLEVTCGPACAKNAGSQTESRCRGFDLPAGRLAASDVPIIVKVVATDRQGRRASGWAVVGPRPPAAVERLAQHVR